ncbi:MAG: TetR/AcrR family transcriptional regulator [Actinomadura sp.]
MAPVNSEYEGDRERILGAAQRCFVRNGMHGTSMEDVSREAGLPEETVNTYFNDRDELVAGIAEQILRLMSGFFAEIRDEETIPPLDDVIERFADTVITVSKGPGRLAPVYWASAMYSEPMAERARAIIQAGRSGWVEIAERELAAGNLAPEADPQAIGNTLVSLLPGILLQRVLFDDVDAEVFRSGVRSLLGAGAK